VIFLYDLMGDPSQGAANVVRIHHLHARLFSALVRHFACS
jgi:hypothetical protein